MAGKKLWNIQKMIQLVLLGYLIALSSYAVAEEELPSAWNMPVNGENGEQEYRDFWKGQILAYLQKYPFAPDPTYCKEIGPCTEFLKKLSAGEFEVIAPDVFSPDDIRPILYGGLAKIEDECPDRSFSVGYAIPNDKNFPPVKGPFYPTHNFAIYDITRYSDLNSRPGISAVKVIRAEHYYVYNEEEYSLTPELMNWGGVRLLALPICEVRGISVAYSSTGSGSDIQGDPFPGIREMILMNGKAYQLNIGHIRDKRIIGNVGIITLSIYALSDGSPLKPSHMQFIWSKE